MADSLFELLTSYIDNDTGAQNARPSLADQTTQHYLSRLTTLSLEALKNTEPASLSQASQSSLRGLQALSKRSHRSVISATDHLGNLSSLLPLLDKQSSELKNDIPVLETAANDFAIKYDRVTENVVLERRKRAMLLNRNADRVGNILELPTLLSSTIGSSSSGQGATTGAASSGYASALDIQAHVKRLKSLYPESDLIKDIARQSDEEIENLISILVTGLQSPALKLASAMRTIGWLRRIAPDLATSGNHQASTDDRGLDLRNMGSDEGSLGGLFLVCRLMTLRRTLDALDPLRELADQETSRRVAPTGVIVQQTPSPGTQTERYLKRYIEIFREHSFSIISMYKSVFPTALPAPGSTGQDDGLMSPTMGMKSPFDTAVKDVEDRSDSLPSALATFTPSLVDMLLDTIREYLPNITDRSARDSLLTQILYCAGSLGRQGADFGMMLAVLEDELAEQDAHEQQRIEDMEWIQVMKKHRVQASRLELLASGVGSGRKTSMTSEIRSPPAVS
ncbi:hypothetical protein MBLNU457_4217t1 [Dothideomycetes sp. NU457]